MNWKNSIYSDGSKYFVTPANPKLGEEMTIRLRVRDNDEIEGVKLRRIKNGSEHVDKMAVVEKKDGWIYYGVTLTMNQPIIQYHFYIFSQDEVFFYNQRGLTDALPVEDFDFKIVADLKNPDWVRRSVFYQIFPDRFNNGNPELTVKTGEYQFDGHDTTQMDWNEAPKEYSDVFCLDFYGGDLPGVEQKIPYFKELGVTALYINPIFYSATSHRYDCLDYFQVDPHLGGDEALASLSSALKEEDMKVILDVSINHTGTAHKWFNKENAFFPSDVGAYQNPEAVERSYYFFDEDNDYHKWYGVETLPTLNYTSQPLRNILYKGQDAFVKKWLKAPYSIDGWRFDVANDMARNDAIDLSHEVWGEIRSEIKETNEEAYLLAEEWLDCSEYLQGNLWDSAMNYFGCARPVRQFVGDGDLFLSRDEDLRKRVKPLTGQQFKERILQHLSKMPYQIMSNQFNLLGSHDTYRLHNNPAIDFSAYEIAVAMMFTLPGAPSIYYGDEVGIDGRIETVEGCRYPMPWEETKWHEDYVHLYKSLAHLKRDDEVLHDGGFKFLTAEDHLVSYARFTDSEAVVVLANMDDHKAKVKLPMDEIGVDKHWQVVEVLGKEVEGEWKSEDYKVKIEPKSVLVLKFTRV